MGTVQQTYNELQQAPPAQIIDEFLQSNADTVAEENRQQLLRGEQADGNKMRGYALAFYEAKKEQMNPMAEGRMDLKLTGAFHRSILFDPRAEEIKSNSDPHDLVGRYGDDTIFGLNDESQAKYVEKNEQKFIDYYRKMVEL